MKKFHLNDKIDIIGFKASTNNKKEMSVDGVIPKLWAKFCQSELFTQDVKYGVYFNYQDRHFADYDIMVGINSKPCDKFDSVAIESGKYIVFEKSGEIHKIVPELWGEIWNFFETSDIKRAYKTDFEKYTDQNRVEIYISIV
ncbi:GyrI-like domain-containing protein [Campylobacter sp.]|uniref:GyrI-like domain-containing protein n=1 Tax=Campylobacter sp. TaxID=205 RepID=UPI0026F72BA3|nr:effector binding domain-containing protein [Campylobacter sp.]